MTDKYRISPDFVVPEPTPARFFAFFTEEDWSEEKRTELVAGWREAGVEQCRVTLVNDDYPSEPYPYGVWVEGWTDAKARQLPFGASWPEGGAVWPPLAAQSTGQGEGS